jgi:ATP-dependent Lon protease
MSDAEGTDSIEIPEELPVLPVRDLVVFPLMMVPLIVARETSVLAVEAAQQAGGDQLVFLVTQRDPEKDEPYRKDLHTVGTIGTITRATVRGDGRMKVLVQGLVRAKVRRLVRRRPYYAARVEAIPDLEILEHDAQVELEALLRTTRIDLERFSASGRSIPEEVVRVAETVEDAARVSDIIAAHLEMEIPEAQSLLSCEDPAERLRRCDLHLRKELDILDAQQRIEDRAREEMSRTQREYFLREQMRAIRSELGDDADDELEEISDRIVRAEMPEPVESEARRQLKRLRQMHTESAEANVVRTYLEWLVELPWSNESEDTLDLEHAQAVLDEDHYGLERIKDRMLEHLAVRKLKTDSRGPILCLVGPPGVGKTSLGRSIARAMGRRFAQASLGGVRDEAEIRGHRRTYVGAMPGRIIQGLRHAGARNPVFMLDELDKIGADARGDPASALLEVLDPAQNHAFRDHYLGVPFDLSSVLFIATANVETMIPSPLLDRMEVIRLAGYTEEEKLTIARRHIVPRALADHGLAREHLAASDDTLRGLIRDYTREAGLRNLERNIAAVCRKVARLVASGKKTRTVVTDKRLREMLGPPRPPAHPLPEEDEVGTVTGLAWTQAGGEVLQVEAEFMRGTGVLRLTGQLGEVMKESAHAALSYLRARAEAYGIEPGFFAENEVHVHVPAGAIPKDGPSAGVTIATAIASVITRRPVDSTVAMTGEITLRGHVLPVGGVKEKLLAAVRAGVKTVLLPAANEVDLEEIPTPMRRKIRIVLCSRVEEVFAEALRPEPAPRAPNVRPKTPARAAAGSA